MDERMIKSPKHYTEGRRFEPKDVIRDWDLNFNLGNAVKYLARAGRKGDMVEDLKKPSSTYSLRLMHWRRREEKRLPVIRRL